MHERCKKPNASIYSVSIDLLKLGLLSIYSVSIELLKCRLPISVLDLKKKKKKANPCAHHDVSNGQISFRDNSATGSDLFTNAPTTAITWNLIADSTFLPSAWLQANNGQTQSTLDKNNFSGQTSSSTLAFCFQTFLVFPKKWRFTAVQPISHRSQRDQNKQANK